MYEYVPYDDHIREIKWWLDDLFNRLCQKLETEGISAKRDLVGSVDRRMILRNGKKPIDFDYNLEILECGYMRKCQRVKDIVRGALDEILTAKPYKMKNCCDSTSALSSRPIDHVCKDGKNVKFTFDLCITYRDEQGFCYRLINHKDSPKLKDKNSKNEYVWERMFNLDDVYAKLDVLERVGAEDLLDEEYLKLKNTYLKKNDHMHPSYVCFFEAINNVYNHLRQTGVL